MASPCVGERDVKELHYWNRANFKGLEALSAELRADPPLEKLAAYCNLREKGLRREALTQLDDFLEEVRHLELPLQRALTLRVLDLHWKFPNAHQFLTVPLRKGFVERVLDEWRAADPEDPVPLRYLALLRRDHGLLDQALRVDPGDDRVRSALAGMLIGWVDDATHHLVEGRFLGDEAEASAALAKAAALLEGATDATSVSALKQDLEALAALLTDWEQYRPAPEGTFPDWCRARNREHAWWSIVYCEGRGAEDGVEDSGPPPTDDPGPMALR